MFFLSAALSLQFHHTPRVEHRTNTRWSSEAYRSGIASPTQRLCPARRIGTIGTIRPPEEMAG
jgi:hypothetical protein